MDERELPPDHESVLEKVRQAATAYSVARSDLHAAFAEAQEAGASLREIGAAAGLAHETVRKVVHLEAARRKAGAPPGMRFGAVEMKLDPDRPRPSETGEGPAPGPEGLS
jgi:hypothetical protein